MVATLAIAGGVGPACNSASATSCGERVVADWSDGRIDGSYPLHCYQKAVDGLPEDVRAYSSAADDISRALQEEVRSADGSDTRVVESSARSNADATSEALPYVVTALLLGLAITILTAAWTARRALRRR